MGGQVQGGNARDLHARAQKYVLSVRHLSARFIVAENWDSEAVCGHAGSWHNSILRD